MEIRDRIIQAYHQAEWRTKLQWSLLILVILVALLLDWGIGLSITSQAAVAGLDVQSLEREKEELERSIADMHTQRALFSSESIMAQRAAELGFVPGKYEEAIYIVVKNYGGKGFAMMAPPPRNILQSNTLIKPIYTQSIWEWVINSLNALEQERNGKIK